MLPQTGLLRWPVPVLSASGVLMTAAGIHIVRKEDDEAAPAASEDEG